MGEEVAANRRNWDERTPVHLASRMYDVDGFVADPGRITSVVRLDLPEMAPHLPGGSVEGLRLVHLQCHIGTDTLSWARLGAEVTGIDFSAAAVTAARDLAGRCGLPARFLESTVHDAAAACPERFDVVYTGVGALPWLPDLPGWARVVAAMLTPGGVFHLREDHPVLSALDRERADGELVLSGAYFDTGAPARYDEAATYTDGDADFAAATTFEWSHSLADVVSALLDAGLRLVALREHTTVPWRALPVLVESPDGWALPRLRERAPLSYSLTATLPA